jgi:hypothetical protein
MPSMPLTRIPPGELRRLAVPTLVLYTLVLLPFLFIGEPGEMVALQMAGSESRAREIVAEWSEAETVDMAFLQGLDELQPLVYGLLLAVAAVWAGRRLRGRAAAWGPAVAWLAVAAAVLDLLENVGMIVMIRGDVDAPVPTITTVFAVAKFAAIVLVLAYVVAGLVGGRRSAG